MEDEEEWVDGEKESKLADSCDGCEEVRYKTETSLCRVTWRLDKESKEA